MNDWRKKLLAELDEKHLRNCHVCKSERTDLEYGAQYLQVSITDYENGHSYGPGLCVAALICKDCRTVRLVAD